MIEQDEKEQPGFFQIMIKIFGGGLARSIIQWPISIQNQDGI